MEELVERMLTGSEESWNEFLENYSRLIYKVFTTKSFWFSNEEVEELFNEFLLNLMKDDYKKVRLFEGRNNCSFASYLKKIAINQAIDRRKKLVRTRMLSIHHPLGVNTDERGSELVDTLDSGAQVPEESLIDDEERRQYLEVLYQLPPARLLLVLMLVYHRFDRVELATMLKTTRQNVDVIFNRCKEKLKNNLEKGRAPGQEEAPATPWIQDVLDCQKAVLMADRAVMLDRCVQFLNIPDELLVGIVFINALPLHPTPERLAPVFDWPLAGTQDNVLKVLRKVTGDGAAAAG